MLTFTMDGVASGLRKVSIMHAGLGPKQRRTEHLGSSARDVAPMIEAAE